MTWVAVLKLFCPQEKSRLEGKQLLQIRQALLFVTCSQEANSDQSSYTKNIKTRRKVVRYIWLIKDASMIRKAHWKRGLPRGPRSLPAHPESLAGPSTKLNHQQGHTLLPGGVFVSKTALRELGWDNWMASMTFESPHFKQL